MAKTAASKQVRFDAETRRQHLLDVAQRAFAAKGYGQTGLAEIASQASVSKTLLYHYFPEGRPQLFYEVMSRLTNELTSRIRQSVGAPVSAKRRVRSLVEAFLGFFHDEPTAFRLLILEPWGSGDARIVGEAMAVRIRVGEELNTLLAPAGLPANQTLAASSAAIGCLLQICESWTSDQISQDDAVQVGTDFVCGGLRAVGLLK